MKLLKYILPATIAMTMASCDTDIVPRGQTLLSTAEELEYLLNICNISERPADNLGVVVNEDYCANSKQVQTLIANENTLDAAHLTYNESIDRNQLNSSDTRYVSLYKNINSENIIIGRIDNAEGDERIKPRVKAEAHLMRAYMYYLVAGIYAAQYDENTAAQTGGIVYTTSYDASPEPKPQLTLDKTWEKILADCDDEFIAELPDEAVYNRCSKATGYAIKAKVLFQMKRYKEALTYAQEALKLNSTIEDRRVIETSLRWNLKHNSPNNLIYIPVNFPWYTAMLNERFSRETVELFEPGDMLKEYAYYYPYKRPNYVLIAEDESSGVPGCYYFRGNTVYDNTWGITVERMMYLAAECLIRTGKIQDGMDIVNDIRENRIHASKYQEWSASTEKEAMEKLQRAKFIENLGSYENFFDRKRWNTEADYKKVITRSIPGLGEWSIQPDSKLWIMPMPVQVFQNNPNVTSNI